MKTKTIAKTKYADGYTIEFKTDFNKPFKRVELELGTPLHKIPKNDIQILFKKKGGETLLSAISKYGSYGVKENLWEISPHHTPAGWEDDDSIKGHLTFSEVMHYIEEQYEIDRKGAL